MPNNSWKKSAFLIPFCFFLLLSSGCLTGTLPDKQISVDSHIEFTNDSVPKQPTAVLKNNISPSKRIISQNDDATELLIAIGASDSIVGITDTAMKKNYLADKLPHAKSIGDWLFPDIETILLLKPDAIVSYSTSKPKNLEKIAAANLSIVYCDSYRINTLVSDARKLGELTGYEEDAARYIAFNEKYQSLVDSRIPKTGTGDLIRVYIEGYSDYSVMTERSAGGRILQVLHIRNIYGNHTSDWATVNPEWVIAQNPEVIIKMATDPAKGENMTSVRQRILNREGYSTITAVKNNRVYVMNGEIGSSPRVVIGLVYAAKAIYPDRFYDINPKDILLEYDREFVAGTGFEDAFAPEL